MEQLGTQGKEAAADVKRLQQMTTGMHDSGIEVTSEYINHLTMLFLVRSNRTTARFRAASNMLGSSVRPMLPTGSGTLAAACLLYTKCRTQAWRIVSHTHIDSQTAYVWYTL